MMFTPLSQIEASGVPFLTSVLSPAEAKRIFLHTALMESLFGGLIAGKINEDVFSAGLKHATFLSIASGLAFFFFFI